VFAGAVVGQLVAIAEEEGLLVLVALPEFEAKDCLERQNQIYQCSRYFEQILIPVLML
jgi:hypothetical protein